jgi:hypothetical protein
VFGASSLFSASGDIFSQGQGVLLLLVIVVVVALSAVLKTTGVLWRLLAELLDGFWSGLKAVALLLIVLFLLVYLMAHGLGPGSGGPA